MLVNRRDMLVFGAFDKGDMLVHRRGIYLIYLVAESVWEILHPDHLLVAM